MFYSTKTELTVKVSVSRLDDSESTTQIKHDKAISATLPHIRIQEDENVNNRQRHLELPSNEAFLEVLK